MWRLHLQKHWPLLTLVGVWAFMVLIIWPVGEFAINDDFGFSIPVYWWVEKGDFEFTYWQAMTLAGQVWLGAMWSEIFGFSQTNLRLLSTLLACGSLLWVYGLSREAGNDKFLSFVLAALLMAFAPFVAVSNSFMTDAPFLFFAIAALFFFSKTVGRHEKTAIVFFLGCAALLMALLIRQTAFAIAVGYLVAQLIAGGPNATNRLRAIVVFAGAVLFLAFYPRLIGIFAELPPDYFVRTDQVKQIIGDLVRFKIGALSPAIMASLNGAVYLGLFAAPLTLPLLVMRVREKAYGLFDYGALLAGAILVMIAFLLGQTIPDVGNVLTHEGIGPRLVFLGDRSSDQPGVWLAINIAAMVSFATLTAESFRGARHLLTTAMQDTLDRRSIALISFLGVTAFVAYAPYGLNYMAWFDRYVLFPGIVALIALSILCRWSIDSRSGRAGMIAVLGIGVIAATVLTHDFFSWSRARADLTHEAVSTLDLSPEQLDGGFEFNNYSRLLQAVLSSAPDRAITNADDRIFRIANYPHDEYEIIMRRPVGQILPLGSDMIYLLQKQ